MPKGNKKIVTTAPAALKILWEEGIFKNLKKISEVIKELSKKGYHFPLKSVDMALQRATYLTRKGKRGGYEYIQKYPFFKDEK